MAVIENAFPVEPLNELARLESYNKHYYRMGKCLEFYSQHYPLVTDSGDEVTVGEAIRRMASVVDTDPFDGNSAATGLTAFGAVATSYVLRASRSGHKETPH